MKKLLFLILPLSALAQEGKEFKLKADLKLNKTAEMVYLSYRNGDERVTDSLPSAKGELTFKGNIMEPVQAMFRVKYAKQPGEERNKQEAIQLFLEPGTMELKAKDSLLAYDLKGSAAHKDYLELEKELKPFNDRMNALYEEYSRLGKAKDMEGQKKVEASIDALDEEMREKVYKGYYQAHLKSPIALYALRSYAGYQIDADKVDPLFASLPQATQQWPSAVSLKEQIDIAKMTGIGKIAPDFKQNDTLGNPFSLSSLRGKYVLVDFWASWCGPCRKENPNVVKAFNRFKDRNFTILGVSLDRPGQQDRWMKAIHDDGLTWYQVSDLKFWDNEVAKQYGIRAIPANILIDPTGKIIAKNLNGEALVKKLESVLGASTAVR